jgi:lytic cellulose monooxygenase (C4-dehydrogenating)
MRLRTLRVAAATLATGLLAAAGGVVLADAASAHGAVSDPVTRAYDCNQRWQSPSDPGMQSQDPMCYQAYQADPNAMYNWNGLFREGVAGRHQAVIPDGTLCSGGLTQGGRYAAMDVPGRWNAVNKPNSFTLKLNDPSSHGADYLRIYITRQGFDPLTQRLTWGALELVAETGRQAPSQTYTAQVNAGSRTGRHIVYTIWQASHLDQSYYACSDVVFGGGTDPGPGPSTPAPSTPAPSTPAPSTPAPSTPAPGACTATIRVAGQWQGGYQAEVQVRAGDGGTRGWTVSFTGTVQQGWNATFRTSGSSTVATNVAYNGSLAANGTTTFGFIGTGTPPTASVCTAA